MNAIGALLNFSHMGIVIIWMMGTKVTKSTPSKLLPFYVNEIEKMHPGRIRSGRAIGNYGPLGYKD